jgi:hypothetical protein
MLRPCRQFGKIRKISRLAFAPFAKPFAGSRGLALSFQHNLLKTYPAAFGFYYPKKTKFAT